MARLLDKPIVSPILVGRTAELNILHQLTDTAQRGHGQVVLIAGEAGMGKSRLVKEAVAFASAHRFRTFQGNCFPPDFACPFAPILDLFHNPITAGAAAATPQMPSELSRLLASLVPTETITASALDPEHEKRRLFAGLAQFFMAAASKQPTVLVIEDIQWSDDTSLEFFHYLARRVAPHRMILLLTYRSDERPAHLRQWLAQMDRERLSQELRLAPLKPEHFDEMIRRIFQNSHPVPGELLDKLYALTEGNPFFLEEILKSLSSANENFTADSLWDDPSTSNWQTPQSVQEAVRQRTNQLSTASHEVVIQAAVIGRRFRFDLLRHLTGLDEGQLLIALKELVAAQLIVEQASDQFAFRHALTRQVVYAELLSRERRALHQRIAEAVESVYAEELEDHWADLADHFWQAEQWRASLNYSLRAGSRSQALYAPRATVEHFTRALAAAQRLSVPPSPEHYRARGQAYEMLGEFDRARLDYETALELSRSLEDQRSAWQSLLDLGQLWAGRDYTQTGDYYRRALQMARSLDDPAGLAHSLNRYGNWCVNIEQPIEGQRFHREAASIFERLNDQRGVAETYDLLGMASYRSSDLPGAAEHYQQAIALFRAMGERKGLVSSLSMLTGCAWNYSTNTAVPASLSGLECINAGQEALQIARDIHWRAGEAYAHICLSWCLGAHGDYGRALANAQAGLSIAEAIEHRQWVTAAHWTLGAIYLDLLALPKAQHAFESALALARELGSAIWINHVTGLLASTYMTQGDDPRAEAVLDTLPPDMGYQTLGQRQCWCARAELTFARGDFNQTFTIAQRLLASALYAGADEYVALPRLAILVGEALTGLKRPGEAESIWRSILQDNARQISPPLAWRFHRSLGQLYQAMQLGDEAEREYAAARLLIQALAKTVADEADRSTFLQGALAATGPAPAPRVMSSGLTAREMEVARLVAQGASNRAIADALFISERTVESHVSSVLSKMNFSSRAQIAAWVIEQGLNRAS